jgi:hypothetical protein
MKQIVAVCFVLIFMATALAASGRIAIAPTSIKGSVVLDIANNSEMKTLDHVLKGVGANLWLRLFSIGEEGSCVPETHAVCGFRYYLAVREDGEEPALALFYLGHVGEIEDIKAFDIGGPDGVILQFTVTNYPKEVLQRVRRLKRESKTYRAIIEKEVGDKKSTYKLRLE